MSIFGPPAPEVTRTSPGTCFFCLLRLSGEANSNQQYENQAKEGNKYKQRDKRKHKTNKAATTTKTKSDKNDDNNNNNNNNNNSNNINNNY